MAWVTSVLIAVQVICAIAIIVLVLLQHGKGADMGAAFGSGASGSLFGATGSANFLSRATGVMAGLFFIATLGLAYSSNHLRASRTTEGGVMSTLPQSTDSKADGASNKVEPVGDKSLPTDAGKSPSEIPK